MAEPRRVPLHGSERTPVPGARLVGPWDAGEHLEVTLRLRPRAPLPAASPRGEQALSREEYAARHGAAAEDVERVRAFAATHGLEVVDVHAGRRAVVLAGTAGLLSQAFGVELQRWEIGGEVFRGRLGPLHVPADLAEVIEGVFGLDDRPQAQPHFRRAAMAPVAAATREGAFTVPQIGRLYGFPADLDGSGQTIAVIELGGGYTAADLDAFFGGLDLRTPTVVDVFVDGGSNAPTGDPSSADGEVVLDIEVAGALAPGARIAVYFAPNTERGFLDAVSTAVHDGDLQPSVISISWGAAESTWTSQAMRAMDQVFQSAAALGVAVCAAAGDNGSSDGVADGRQHVDFPASSPHVLACGGTRLEAGGDTVAAETVWNDGPGAGATGGGISDVFALPSWQADAGVPESANGDGRIGRGVPDVAADADPATGYLVRVDGEESAVGGTSAVAPLWAALLTLAGQRLGRPVGFVNPLLYSADVSQALRDVTDGGNGAYAAQPGWDACTGLGVPDAASVIEALAG